MKLVIDTTAQTLVQDTGTEQHTIPLHSKAAFELLSHLWVKLAGAKNIAIPSAGWADQSYSCRKIWCASKR